VLEINLGALRANWTKLKNLVGPSVDCAGVIKADGYGLGLEPIARALSAEGCRTFFVATLNEGQRLRHTLPTATIYILDGLLPLTAAHCVESELRPVLSSLPELEEWASYCRNEAGSRPAAIQIDTGMNRLGIALPELEKQPDLAGLCADFDVALIMSHLACADQPASPMNARQLQAFQDARSLLPSAPASLANSGGIFLDRSYHFELVRPGIALYGGRAFEGRPNPMQSVVRLAARILQVRDANPGDTVGYSAAHTLSKPMRIATIACGYADGLLRAITSRDKYPAPVVYIDNHPATIIGRVSMDLITLDVSAVPRDLAVRGGWVEVIGDRVTIDDLSDRAGTIGYELLTRLSNRIHRIYSENPVDNEIHT